MNIAATILEPRIANLRDASGGKSIKSHLRLVARKK